MKWLLAAGMAFLGCYLIICNGRGEIAPLFAVFGIRGIYLAVVGLMAMAVLSYSAKRSNVIDIGWALPFAVCICIVGGVFCYLSTIPGKSSKPRDLSWEQNLIIPVFRDGRLVEVRCADPRIPPTYPPGLLRQHEETLEVIEAPRQASFDFPSVYYRMSKLRELTLDRSELSQENFEVLRKLESLETLRMQSMRFLPDYGMRCLAAIPRLKSLDLSSSSVEPLSFAELATSPSIQVLLLNRTEVSDAELLRIAEIKSLKRIEVRDTKVTQRGVDAFSRTRPEVEISYGAEKQTQF